MSVNNKISNILGTALPNWLITQLTKRANEMGQEVRNNDNILYLANKSAWVRVVSSIDIINPSDLSYFQRELGPYIQNEQDLAKQFVLFGGTSKYLNQNSYQQRSGLGKDGSYGMLGDSEIQKYGFRPMPGIQSVTIDTQGTLGSLRLATVNFKCWDKAQLDIIDALYFKLGFSMFLEWGHTFFYPNGSDAIEPTELYSIDPFRTNLSKEQIALEITQNILRSDGNYDAMLGIVSNFTFSYNQEGGYDCTLKIIGLGVLADSIKINNPTALPSLLPEEIVALNNRLLQFARQRARREAAGAGGFGGGGGTTTTTAPAAATPPFLFKNLLDTYRTKSGSNYLNVYSSNKKKTAGSEDATFNYDNQAGKNVGPVLAIRSINGLLPLGDAIDTKIKLNNIINVTAKLPAFAKDSANYKLETPVFGKNEFIFEYAYVSANNKNTYGIQIVAEEIAEIDKNYLTTQDINSVYEKGQTPISTEEGRAEYTTITPDILKEKLWNVLGNKNNFYNLVVANPKLADVLASDLGVTFVTSPATNETVVGVQIEFILSYEINSVVRKPSKQIPDQFGNTQPFIVDNAIVKFNQKVRLVFNDPYLISEIQTSEVQQTEDYLNQIKSQNKVADPAAASGATTPTTEPPAPTVDQVKQSLQYQSGLELTLKTIQVHALNQAIRSRGENIGNIVFALDMTTDTVGGKPFYNQIFSVGVFSKFIKELVDDKITASDDLFKVQSKYGFATEFMAGRVSVKEMDDNNSKVNFKELLTAYVLPYQISQEIVSSINATHPVYIPFGLLLMILNNICTIYDTKDDKQQTPLVYVDFNPNLNFFLSNTKHLSTNPFKVLIPYEGTFEDYKSLFPNEILNKDKTKILPLAGSKEEVVLFDKSKKDTVSQQLPKVKYDGLQNNNYRAKLMNVLVSLDYVTQIIKQNSVKEGSNSVYLKPFIEQLLLDINKYLGDFSSLRLAYNDGGNTFHIVDDQVAPPLPGDQILEPDNKTQIPLVGRFGLAKNLEIKSEVSTKLANMIAISANADVANKATLSTNGDSFGFINTSYKDRYVPVRSELSSSFDPKKGQLDSLKSAAAQFNKTISDFYGTCTPSDSTVDQATNYYIERLSKIKNNEYPTRASAMIPVSVNFTMDGIAGLTMGQAFSISDELIPYTYNNRVVQSEPGLSRDHVNKVGFAIVGLTNTIENNTWNTSVRANMIFLKYATEFTGSVQKVVGISPAPNAGSKLNLNVRGDGEIQARPYTEEELIAFVIRNTEGGYFHPWMYKEDPIKFRKYSRSGETMYGFDRKNNSRTDSPEGQKFWALIDAEKPTENKGLWVNEYEPPEPLKSTLFNIVVKQESDKFREYFNRYIKNKDLQDLIKTDGRLYYNFAKATFNGAGFFQGFSDSITKAYNAGERSTEALLRLFIELRLDIWKAPLLSGYTSDARELIAQGGKRIARQVGIQLQ